MKGTNAKQCNAMKVALQFYLGGDYKVSKIKIDYQN